MPGKVRGGGVKQPLVCFKCNEPGHFARECTSESSNDAVESYDRGGYRGRGGFRGRGRGRMGYWRNSHGKCYRCGEMGHYARDCENDTSPVSGPQRHGRGRPLEHCYRCGKPGHKARECDTDEDTCYNCHKPGHVARDCQEKKECYRCRKMGHSSRECTEVVSYDNGREKNCYNCGKPGHLKSACPTVICYSCDKEGHVAGECPEGDQRSYERHEDDQPGDEYNKLEDEEADD